MGNTLLKGGQFIKGRAGGKGDRDKKDIGRDKMEKMNWLDRHG